MGQAYPIKVREKAGAYALKHGSSGKAAEVYEVSRASAVRWAAQLRETGKITEGKIGGHRKPILEGQEDWLRSRLLQGAHVTLEQVRGELAAQGFVVSHGALWNFVKRLGLSFKKNRSRRRSDTA
jgi:putative transposase